MRLVTVYGSPTPPGKLARGLTLLEDDVRERHGGWDVERLEPRENVTPVAAVWAHDAVERIATADAVVLASPVFRGSITGTLKLLLDMLPCEALRSKPVGILTVGAALQHHLSAERHLRDVLTWFGALTTPNSAFFVDRVFAGADVPDEVLDDLQQFAEQVVVLAETLRGRQFGPDPLTVRYASRSAR
jgi:FMN reductase